MSKKYNQIQDGEWIAPKRQGFKLACCDCGLVHKINFYVEDGHLEMAFERDNRATAASRRNKNKERKE